MIKTLTFLLLTLTSIVTYSQTINLREVSTLPNVLAETSGLEISNPNLFWSHNDSGGEPAIYGIDTLGNLVRTITIANAANADWEDITQDDNGNFYIGDFGNNDNNRKNLRIYKIPNPATFTGNTVIATIINFSYADQSAFPPADSRKNFDMEAMVHFNDSLYLFSKNRTVPYNGYTTLYKLPSIAGTYTAAVVDSFFTGTDPLAGQITAADISPDKKRLVLLSYGKIYCFSNFSGSNFFKGTVTPLAFNGLTQKESICFATNCGVYITDEEAFSIGKKLYYFDICPVTTGLNDWNIDPAIRLYNPYPNPASSSVVVPYQLPLGTTQGKLVIYNAQGYPVKTFVVKNTDKTFLLPTEGLAADTYYCHLQTQSGISYSRKILLLPGQ